jgi:hypothetical protein
MNKHLIYSPFISNRTETIDFKTFCGGGSPNTLQPK